MYGNPVMADAAAHAPATDKIASFAFISRKETSFPAKNSADATAMPAANEQSKGRNPPSRVMAPHIAGNSKNIEIAAVFIDMKRATRRKFNPN
jgi:hypothetical protein